MGKSISQFTQTLTPESDDKLLLQRDNDYYYSKHLDLMLGIQRVVKTLTWAQLSAGTTEVEMVSAQGAGLVIQPFSCALFYDYNGTATTNTPVVRLQHGTSGNLLMISSNGILSGTADKYESMSHAVSSSTNSRMYANSALNIDLDINATSAGTAGTLTVDLIYIVKRFS